MTHRFEYTVIDLLNLETMTSPESWLTWAETKVFRALPRTQEMRHRCMDGHVFLGDGMASHRYNKWQHAAMEHQPSWHVQPGCVYFFT